jgi:pimeloyl-ACP methyl ester carboxylesterase
MTFTPHRRVGRRTIPSVVSGVPYVRLSRRYDNTLPPVIVNHGWPQSSTSFDTLMLQRSGYINALLASGRVLYCPFSGSNWGHPTVTSPDLDGGALGVFDAMIEAADADGLPTDTVSIYSASMGGCNALNWAWRNPTLIDKMYLIAPLVDFGATWDTALANTELTPGEGTIRSSMMAVWGGSDRATFLAAATTGNPADNKASLEVLGSRTKVMLATGDEVVPYANALTFMEDIGATVNTQPGSHFFPTMWTDWSEYEVSSWLEA